MSVGAKQSPLSNMLRSSVVKVLMLRLVVGEWGYGPWITNAPFWFFVFCFLFLIDIGTLLSLSVLVSSL